MRQTYDATIHVPAGMRAVMSAEDVVDAGGTRRRGAARSIRFRMDHAIPPYLIALAVGDLALQADRHEHRRLRRAVGRRQGRRPSSPRSIG